LTEKQLMQVKKIVKLTTIQQNTLAGANEVLSFLVIEMTSHQKYLPYEICE